MTFAKTYSEAVNEPITFGERSRFIARKLYLDLASLINVSEEENYLRCIYCHYVFDDQIEMFEKIIINLRNKGKFISTKKMIDILEGKDKIIGKNFHLSFDDGFKNNFLNAVPILLRHQIPAIFFVPTSIIDADYDTIKNYCVNTTKYKNAIEMLTWEDLKKMLDLGFDIGSHTKTHARFIEISKDQNIMIEEIKGSKIDLEKKLNINCKYISWPFGKMSDIDKQSIQYVKSCNYRACFGAFRGSIVPNETSIFKIPRHHFEAQWPYNHLNYFLRGNKENI